MKNNDVYTQIWKHSLNKLLRKKQMISIIRNDSRYIKRFNSQDQWFSYLTLTYLCYLTIYNKCVWLLKLQRPISHFSIFDNQCAVCWGLGKRGRQFYSVWVEGEISTIWLESKMAFKRLILIKLIIYLLRLIWKECSKCNRKYTKTSIKRQDIIHTAKYQKQPKYPQND